MTRGQRRAHLAVWLVLAPLLIGAIAWGLWSRPAEPMALPDPAAEAAAEAAAR